VIRDGQTVASALKDARTSQILARPQHGAELQQCIPAGGGRVWDPGGEYPVAYSFGNRRSLRAISADQTSKVKLGILSPSAD